MMYLRIKRLLVYWLFLCMSVGLGEGARATDANTEDRKRGGIYSIGVFKDVEISSPLDSGRSISNTVWNRVKIRITIRKWNTVYSVYWEDYYPWYLSEGQIKAESGYNQNAVSPVGAKGLGQFMPKTWEEVSKEIGYDGGDVFSPSLNIQASLWYMYRLRSVYQTPRPEYERHSMALCSYNAGIGNCIKAQEKCNNTLYWTEAKECLPDITGHHSQETITYVDRIWEYSNEIKESTNLSR